jgi:hypothetical protein
VLTYNFSEDEGKKKVAQAPVKADESFDEAPVVIKARKAAKPPIVTRRRDGAGRGRGGRK